MLNKKREKPEESDLTTDEIGVKINNKINLTINGKSKTFEIFENKLIRANILFNEFLTTEKDTKIPDQEKFEKLKKILEICEINKKYNYYYLKYFLKCLTNENENEFNEDSEILAETLNDKDFNELYGRKQSNPAKDIYKLLCLKVDKDKNLDKLNQIYIDKHHNLNVPLLKGNEKLRLIIYRRRIAEKEINIILKDIIKKTEKYFENINTEEEEFNILTFLIITYILKINTKIALTCFKYYLLQIFEPTTQIIEHKNFSIQYYINIKVDKKKDNIFIISNEFESICFNPNNYCLDNLIVESLLNANTPLSILLKRNESYKYFMTNKPKIIDDPEIFQAFKEYFIQFIHSDLIKDVLGSDHKIILELIESNKFKGLNLDDEFYKPLPLFDKFSQGYTDKDVLISFITYFPTLIKNFGEINTKEGYDNIINVYFLYDVCSKFIITLHEILIHLCYGYLYYLTEGEINSVSPKQSKKNKVKQEPDGGYYFESILFGESVKSINLQLIYCLLNGEHLKDSKQKFQIYLQNDFNPNDLNNKGLFGVILKKYPINFKLFNFNETTCDMRQILNNNNINDIISERSEHDCIVFDTENKIFRKRNNN